jgi:hypothetical protein
MASPITLFTPLKKGWEMAKSFNKVPPVLGENFLKPFITHALKI